MNKDYLLAEKLILLTAEGSAGIDQSNPLSVDEVISEGITNASSAFNSANDTVNTLFGGAYGVFFKIGIYVIIFGVGAAGLALIFSNSGNRSEAKAGIIWKVIGALMFFGMVSIVALFQTVGSNLFG